MADPDLPAAPAIEGATHVHSGKVRDLYRIEAGEHAGRLLMVASDRISAFDFVLDTTIPDKGEVLTRMSLWWFDRLAGVVDHHVVSTDVPEVVRGRAVVCEPLAMFPVECVARGYLAGSGLTDYRATGAVCGVPLPAGLEDGSRLPEPIFTPATKAALGDHDENVDFDTVVATVGRDDAEELRRLTLAVYRLAEEVARDRGIVLADTKVEFGRRAGDDAVVLADEVLTPDSSRFWPAAEWRPGRAQPSYDKQIVRDWLLSPASGWDRASGEPPPPLPAEVVDRTRARYVEAFELLTGQSFAGSAG
jgi:phosphoribosylaminoimidazole-succinocarboxamide synthase